VKSDYPIGIDLQAYLTAAKLISSPPSAQEAAIDYDLFTSTARGEFEGFIERRLMAEAGTRVYDWPQNRDGLVFFEEDLAALTTLSWGGAAKSEGTAFRLKPDNAAARGRPYRYVQILGPAYWTTQMGGIAAVTVEGLWGWSDGVPDDAWNAILMRAAELVAPLVGTSQEAQALNAVRIRHGNVEYAFPNTGSRSSRLSAATQSLWDAMKANYRSDMT
jgi:hypothetical protein